MVIISNQQKWVSSWWLIEQGSKHFPFTGIIGNLHDIISSTPSSILNYVCLFLMYPYDHTQYEWAHRPMTFEILLWNRKNTC